MGRTKVFKPDVKKFYEEIYLNPNSFFNKFRIGVKTGDVPFSGPFEELSSQRRSDLERLMKRYKEFLPAFQRIKKAGLVDLKEAGKLVGLPEEVNPAGRVTSGLRMSVIDAVTRSRESPVATKFLNDVLKKKLNLQKIDVGQGQPTYFIKKPNAKETQLLKDYYLTRGSFKGGLASGTISLVEEFHNNLKNGKYVRNDGTIVKAGEIIPKELLPKNTTVNQAAYAQHKLAQLYDGKKFPNTDIDIPLNKSAARSYYKLLAGAPFNNPYKMAQTKDAMDTITRELGKDYFTIGKRQTNMDAVRRKVKRLFLKEGIRFWDPKVDKASRFGVNINEIIGMSAASRIPGAAPYSQFFNLLEGKVNTADYALFQRRWEEYLTRMNEAKTNKARAGIIREYNKFTKGYLEKITDPFARKTLKQTGFPTLSLKPPEKIYGIKETARLTEQGVNLPKAFEKMKFTIGVKKGTPVLKDVLQSPEKFIAHAKKILLDQVEKGGAHSKSCELILSKQTGGIARTCAAAITKDPIGSANKLANLEATSGPLAKVKDVARGILGTVGKFGARAAPLAAVAAVGAAAEPLVKKFMVDDPTTYLTDENQMKGMLLATIEGETPKVDEEILKWQYPGMAASAAAAIPGSSAMMKARRAKGFGTPRAALGPVGKFLAGSFSPLGVAATLPLHIAAQRKGGTDWGDIATDPMNWMAPAFASSGAKMATRGMAPTGILAKAIRMGMSPRALMLGSRFLGWPGLALTAGMWGYDKWKNRDRDD